MSDQRSDMVMPNISEMRYPMHHISDLLVHQLKKKTKIPKKYLVVISTSMISSKQSKMELPYHSVMSLDSSKSR